MDKVRRDRRKNVHTRLDFGEGPKERTREDSHHSSARARTTKPERLKVQDRLRYGDRHVLDRLGHRRQSADHPRGRSRPHRLDTSNEDRPKDRERFRSVGESYDDSFSHSYRDGNRSRQMKRRRDNESPLSSVSKSDSSDEKYRRLKSKRHKSTDEEDLTRPWMCQGRSVHTSNPTGGKMGNAYMVSYVQLNPNRGGQELTKRLNEHVPKTMEEMIITATAFIRGEAAAASKKKGHASWKAHDQSKRKNSDKRSDFRGHSREGRGSNRFTPLTRTPKEILAAEAGKFQPPPPMVTPVEKRSSNKFCDFHNDKGHNTDECMQLKKQIEELVRAGKLSHLIKEIKHGRDQLKTRKKETSAKDKPTTIYMVQSWQRTTRKKVTQSFERVKEITFPPLAASSGTEGPLVIEAEMGGHMIHRMYVDGGSSMEILYEHCFNRLRPEIKSQMVLATTSLTGFSGKTIWPLRQLRLLVIIGDANHSKRAWMNFMIVRSLSPYNGIIGRPEIREIQAVPSTVHRMLKFPVEGGIVTICSTVLIPTECTSVITSSAVSKEERTRPDNFKVALHPDFPDQKVAIGGTLSDKGCTELCSILKKNMNLFAWKPSNMTGVPQGPKTSRGRDHERGLLPRLAVQSSHGKETRQQLADVCRFREFEQGQSIQLAELDEEKTTFHTGKGVYCYTKMPFGLKNVGATYQRLMDKAFESQIGRNIESIMLGEHNITYRQRTSVKGQILANFLIEMPDENPQAAPVAETQQEPWTLFTDSSSCVDGSGVGLILTNPKGIEFTYSLRFQFAASNNEAEYETLITGTYVAKEDNMVKYMDKVKSLVRGFTNFSISQVPRSKNKKADALSKIASTSFAHLSKQVLVVLKDKSIQEKEVETVVEEDGPTWMTPIMEYLKEGTLPSDRKEVRKLRIKARRYELMEGILYRRSFLTPWLRCVGPLQAEYVIREIHEGSCSMHVGPRSVVAKAIWLGYYWPIMHRDACDMIRKCNDCQIHRPITRSPQQPLTPIMAPWLFYKWGIDIAGPFSEGPGKVKFLIVVMDYFTKWIEAKAVATITSGQSNGLVERANQSLREGIKARLEIRMPTYRTATVDIVSNDEELRLNLDLLEERRKRAVICEAKANNDASHAVTGGKLGPKWEGPYEVTKALGDGAYKLRSIDGTIFPRT
uniref:Reverse transcriptase domain-containing protein n=1 Tax=Tanacetum cinerariifolium TaxID=118510 RepID=A0A699H2Y8_TANCI|nr:reverse transcriptase domain-containing protein [Tanacetum cinerariifolium]